MRARDETREVNGAGSSSGSQGDRWGAGLGMQMQVDDRLVMDDA